MVLKEMILRREGHEGTIDVFMNSVEEVETAFQKLKEGGEVIVELGPQFFSPMYGSIKDRFGVTWQLIK